jgi:hypothetical protein
VTARGILRHADGPCQNRRRQQCRKGERPIEAKAERVFDHTKTSLLVMCVVLCANPVGALALGSFNEIVP